MRYTTSTRPVKVWNDLFEQFFNDNPLEKNHWSSFAVDALEKGENYLITADLPGFEEEELEITVKDQTILIKAEKPSEEEKDDKEKSRYLIKERGLGNYRRRFTLPKDADKENIKANLSDGVLVLTIKKLEEAIPLTIKVNG